MQTANFVATLFDGKSNPAKATVAFTMALNAVKKGHSAMVLLMVEAVELGLPDATAEMDVGAPFAPVAKLATGLDVSDEFAPGFLGYR